jgi:hypothetical protein
MNDIRASLSRIGGAAQGGSAKPKEEREELDRDHGQPQEESPGAASTGKGTVGGTSNDDRTDQQREQDARGD